MKSKKQAPAVKHTSGKWFGGPAFHATITGRGRCNMFGIGNGSVHIGYVSITAAVPEAEALANVRLIVHASDLLEACQETLAEVEKHGFGGSSGAYGTGRVCADLLRGAIRKATGSVILT